MFRFLKTTVLGGVVFLVPIIIFIAVIGKALELTNKLAAPLAERLPVDSVGDLAVVHLLALAILVLVCFVAGLAAKTAFAGRLVQSLEANVLDKIPAYAVLKSKTGSVLNPEDAADMRPVLARFDDSWQLAFEIERIEGGQIVVFLPGAPDPWSGSVCVVTEDRITPLDVTVRSAAELMKRLGKGTTEALRGSLRVANSSP
ncbi:MAG: DUF502 domain-containing protein [Gammaproteobacteria bacterium]